MGRRRLPPEEISWFANLGIICPPEPALATRSWFTRSMSVLVRSTSGFMEDSLFLFPSRGMTTPDDPDSCSFFDFDNRKGRWRRQEVNCRCKQIRKGKRRQMHEL